MALDSVPNSTFPVFRTNLNASLAEGAKQIGALTAGHLVKVDPTGAGIEDGGSGADATSIQGFPVSSTPATEGQVLQLAPDGSPAVDKWVPTTPSGGSGNYQTVEVGGSAQTQRAKLNLIEGAGVTLTPADNSGANSTDVTIAATGGGGIPSGGSIGNSLENTASGTASWEPETFPVRAFGATGGGSTDDTTALQAAITAAAGGGRVYFAPGIYLTQKLTVANPNIELILAAGAVLKLKASTNAHVVEITASHCAIRGGEIDGNKTNQSATSGCAGVHVNAAGSSQTLSDVTVDGVYIHDTVNQGVLVEQTGSGAVAERISVRNNRVYNTGSASVAAIAEGIALYDASLCEVKGNTVDTTANHGVVSTRGSNNQIVGNRLINNGGNFNNGFAHAVAIDGNGGSNPNSGHLIQGNYCELSRDHVIEIADGVSAVVIDSNIINGSASTSPGAIYFGGSLARGYMVTISNNVINGVNTPVYGHGIIIEGLSGAHTSMFSITGNQILLCKQHGIYIHYAEEGTISGNTVLNCGSAAGNTYDGLNLSTYDRITITGNRFADDQGGGATQRYGINFTAAPIATATAVGNEVAPNVSAGIALPGSNGATGIRTANNPGFNPVGTSAYTPEMPASGSSVTNDSGYDVTMFVTASVNGTVLYFDGNGVAGLSNLQAFCVRIAVGQTIGFSWSGSAPHWIWFGE